MRRLHAIHLCLDERGLLLRSERLIALFLRFFLRSNTSVGCHVLLQTAKEGAKATDCSRPRSGKGEIQGDHEGNKEDENQKEVGSNGIKVFREKRGNSVPQNTASVPGEISQRDTPQA